MNDQGIRVVICTGRPIRGVKAYMDLLQQIGNLDYIILNNGGSVHRFPSLEVIDATYLSHTEKESVYQLWQSVREGNAQFVGISHDGFDLLESEEASEHTLFDANRINIEIQHINYDEFMARDYLKIIAYGSVADLDQLHLHIPSTIKESMTVIRSQPNIIEFLPQGINKRRGIDYLVQRWNIPWDAIMTIGDERNDIDMLQAAGVGVAMANADDEVKQYADEIAGFNHEEGVAAFIRHYFKLK